MKRAYHKILYTVPWGHGEGRLSSAWPSPESVHHFVSQAAEPKHPKQRGMLWGLPEVTRYGEPGLTVGRCKRCAAGLRSAANVC